MYQNKTIYEESVPYGEFIPFGNDIDIEKDKLFDKKMVSLKDKNGKIYSKHLVGTYLITQGRFKGRMYHIFTWQYGKSVINYDPEDYYNLSEFVDISFGFTIFQNRKEDESVKLPVSPDYRLSTK